MKLVGNDRIKHTRPAHINQLQDIIAKWLSSGKQHSTESRSNCQLNVELESFDFLAHPKKIDPFSLILAKSAGKLLFGEPPKKKTDHFRSGKFDHQKKFS